MTLEEALAPNTPSQRLKELATNQDRDLRRALLANPNTPLEVLLELAKDFPSEFLENPSLPSLLLENPSLILGASLETIESLLQVATPPAWLLVSLASHQDRTIRAQVAQHPNTPIAALEVLAKDNAIVRFGETSHDACGGWGTPDVSVLWYVVYNKSTPGDVLRQIFQENRSDLELHSEIAKNANTPSDVLEKLAQHYDRETRELVEAHPNFKKAATK